MFNSDRVKNAKCTAKADLLSAPSLSRLIRIKSHVKFYLVKLKLVFLIVNIGTHFLIISLGRGRKGETLKSGGLKEQMCIASKAQTLYLLPTLHKNKKI